jgi:hypothetical protein
MKTNQDLCKKSGLVKGGEYKENLYFEFKKHNIILFTLQISKNDNCLLSHTVVIFNRI